MMNLPRCLLRGRFINRDFSSRLFRTLKTRGLPVRAASVSFLTHLESRRARRGLEWRDGNWGIFLAQDVISEDFEMTPVTPSRREKIEMSSKFTVQSSQLKKYSL